MLTMLVFFYIAIWVRSGDIMLMTGPSRTAFHAVPCIVTKHTDTTPDDIGTCPLVLNDDNHNDDCENESVCNIQNDKEHVHLWKNEMKKDWREFSDYISNTRININIRQVHKYNKDA